MRTDRLFFRRRRKTPYFIGFFVLLIAAALFFGLLLRKPLLPGSAEVALVRQDFTQITGWRTANFTAALTAFRASCRQIDAKPPTAAMGGAGYAGTAGEWRTACRAAANVKPGFERDFFKDWFVPFSVVSRARPEGLFTGYFEPEIAVSRVRQGIYSTPIYGKPADLVSADLGVFRPGLRGEHVSGKVVNGRLVPYASRADIDANGLPTAPVLLYAADPVETFFLQVQGSGRGRLPDGSAVRLAYAARNGRPYTAIGRTLVQDGALKAGDLSLASIRDWLKRHPERAQSVMERNASYIFFAVRPLGNAATGAVGAQNVPLSAGASLAVDTRIHPLGIPMFLVTHEADGTPLNGLFVAQDRGGAIAGAIRADIYCGIGDAAEQRAGGLKSPGEMYVLLPRPVAARIGGKWIFSGAGK